MSSEEAKSNASIARECMIGMESAFYVCIIGDMGEGRTVLEWFREHTSKRANATARDCRRNGWTVSTIFVK